MARQKINCHNSRPGLGQICSIRNSSEVLLKAEGRSSNAVILKPAQWNAVVFLIPPGQSAHLEK
jgi:hypothetical protein